MGMGVTPFTGVWVEISLVHGDVRYLIVTPFTGVWVEIAKQTNNPVNTLSRPSRACELKFLNITKDPDLKDVTPFTGVWVEIKHYLLIVLDT